MSTKHLKSQLEEILRGNSERSTKASAAANVIRLNGAHRWVGIYDVDAKARLVKNIAWSGPAAPEYPIFPMTRGLTSRAIAQKRTVNVGDVTVDRDYLTALSSTRSEIVIPILAVHDGEVIGTLDVESERLNAFDSAIKGELEDCAAALSGLWAEEAR